MGEGRRTKEGQCFLLLQKKQAMTPAVGYERASPMGCTTGGREGGRVSSLRPQTPPLPPSSPANRRKSYCGPFAVTGGPFRATFAPTPPRHCLPPTSLRPHLVLRSLHRRRRRSGGWTSCAFVASCVSCASCVSSSFYGRCHPRTHSNRIPSAASSLASSQAASQKVQADSWPPPQLLRTLTPTRIPTLARVLLLALEGAPVSRWAASSQRRLSPVTNCGPCCWDACQGPCSF